MNISERLECYIYGQCEVRYAPNRFIVTSAELIATLKNGELISFGLYGQMFCEQEKNP